MFVTLTTHDGKDILYRPASTIYLESHGAGHTSVHFAGGSLVVKGTPAEVAKSLGQDPGRVTAN